MGPELPHDPGNAPENPFLKFRSRTLIPWTIVGGLVLVVAIIIVSSAGPMASMDSAIQNFVVGLALYGLLASWIVWACRRGGVDLRRLVGRVPAGYGWWPVVGLLATTLVFSLGSAFVVAYGLSHLAPEFLESLLTMQDLGGDSLTAGIAWIILATTVVPVTEEVLFRGVLVSRWGVKWGIGTGIIVSAVVFGSLHAIGLVGATAFGFVAAVLYFQSRTLLVPMAFHALNNLVATLPGVLPMWDEPLTLAAEIEEIQGMAFPGLAMMAVTLPVLVWYIRRNWPSRDAEIPYMRE